MRTHPWQLNAILSNPQHETSACTSRIQQLAIHEQLLKKKTERAIQKGCVTSVNMTPLQPLDARSHKKAVDPAEVRRTASAEPWEEDHASP